MVQNPIIAAVPVVTACTFTDYLPLQINFSWPSASTSVYPPPSPTRVLYLEPFFTPILLPSADVTEVPSPTLSSLTITT